MIKIKTYILRNSIALTSDILNVYLTEFWKDIYQPITNKYKNKHLMIMCKIHFKESSLGYRTLGKLRSVNFTDMELFLSYLSERIGVLSDSYTVEPLNKISFTYIIKDVAYTLKATTHFREAIYINGVYEGTKLYFYDMAAGLYSYISPFINKECRIIG